MKVRMFFLTAGAVLSVILSSCMTAPRAPTEGIDSSPETADAAAPARISATDITGHWEGDWGSLYMKAQGTDVVGVYTYNDGRIIGTLDGDVFRGWWSEAPGRTPPDEAGVVEFRFIRQQGNILALDGRWKYGDDPEEEWSEDWDLQWTGPGIPADIEELFTLSEDFVEG
jgi:hypothetical protein